MAFNRRRRGPYHFGTRPRRPPRQPIIESKGVQAKRRTKCWGCSNKIEVGDPFVRLRLRKQHRNPCTSCGREPKGAKRFHVQCAPTDDAGRNKAMGFVAQQAAPPPPPFTGTPINRGGNGGAVPPPPKPPTFEEAALAAISQLEAALVLKVRGKKPSPELEGEFRKFQGIKARVLRGTTAGEQEVATSLALQKLVKMVFAN